MTQIGISHSDGVTTRTKYVDGLVARGATPAAPADGMLRMQWADSTGQLMTLFAATEYTPKVVGPNGSNPRPPAAGKKAIGAAYWSGGTYPAGGNPPMEATVFEGTIPTPTADTVVLWWIDGPLVGALLFDATVEVFAATAKPSIVTPIVNTQVQVTNGTYSLTPDTVQRAVIKTLGGVDSELVLPYTYVDSDNGAIFRAVEVATRRGETLAPNFSDSVVLVVTTVQAKPLASVTAVANHAAGTITFTMVSQAGETPDGYRVGIVGRPLVFVTEPVVTLPFAPGTGLVPTASAVVGTSISSAVNGPAVNLFTPLSVSGTLEFTTGGEATQGEILAYSGLSIVGASSVQHRWTDDGATISGQTGATLDTAGRLGTIGLEIAITGEDGSAMTRSATVSVVAPPTVAASAVQNLRIGTTAGDGLPLVFEPPVSAGSSAITRYDVTYTAVGGATVTAQFAPGAPVVITDAAQGERTFTVTAFNGAQGLPATLQVSVRLYLGFVASTVYPILFTALEAGARARGTCKLTVNSITAGASIEVRSQSGALLTTATAAGDFVFPITSERSLIAICTGGTSQFSLQPFAFTAITNAQATLSPVAVGSVAAIQAATFSNLGNLQIRYGWRFYDTPGGNFTQSAPEDRTTSLTLPVPLAAEGKLLFLETWVYDPLLDVYPVSRAGTINGLVYSPSVAGAYPSITVTNTTAQPGELVLLSAIPGYTPAKGIRVTVAAMTDAGQTGGVAIKYRDSVAGAGDIQPVDLFGYSLAGSVYDFFPGPDDPNANGQAAFFFAPAGSGTYSYTLTVQARP